MHANFLAQTKTRKFKQQVMSAILALATTQQCHPTLRLRDAISDNFLMASECRTHCEALMPCALQCRPRRGKSESPLPRHVAAARQARQKSEAPAPHPTANASNCVTSLCIRSNKSAATNPASPLPANRQPYSHQPEHSYVTPLANSKIFRRPQPLFS
jgi:hypothetical protein